MEILVTGGAGFIGSHACLVLLEAGHKVAALDNLANSSEEALDRVRHLTGRELAFHRVDVCDRVALEEVFGAHRVDAVMHFAGLKAVGESTEEPLLYYRNNVGGTLALVEAMRAHDVRDLVFSSSATVYGNSTAVPFREDAPLAPVNPYGRSKVMIEGILSDVAAAESGWRISLLRYFNPVGAHESGRIGEDPSGIPNNLLPYVMQVAIGRLPHVRVWGDDWETPDGTGIRDYIHVMDLVEGHLAALEHLPEGCDAYNLGTGKGVSVLEMIDGFARACGSEVPYRIEGRRPGDIAVSYADPSRTHSALRWRATRGIDEICVDAWRWQLQNPAGYERNSG